MVYSVFLSCRQVQRLKRRIHVVKIGWGHGLQCMPYLQTSPEIEEKDPCGEEDAENGQRHVPVQLISDHLGLKRIQDKAFLITSKLLKIISIHYKDIAKDS